MKGTVDGAGTLEEESLLSIPTKSVKARHQPARQTRPVIENKCISLSSDDEQIAVRKQPTYKKARLSQPNRSSKAVVDLTVDEPVDMVLQLETQVALNIYSNVFSDCSCIHR